MAMRPCPVAGCTARISAELLLCRHHWQRVPLHLRNLAWQRYHESLRRLQRTGSTETSSFLDVRQLAAEAAARSTLADFLEEVRRAA